MTMCLFYLLSPIRTKWMTLCISEASKCSFPQRNAAKTARSVSGLAEEATRGDQQEGNTWRSSSYDGLLDVHLALTDDDLLDEISD